MKQLCHFDRSSADLDHIVILGSDSSPSVQAKIFHHLLLNDKYSLLGFWTVEKSSRYMLIYLNFVSDLWRPSHYWGRNLTVIKCLWNVKRAMLNSTNHLDMHLMNTTLWFSDINTRKKSPRHLSAYQTGRTRSFKSLGAFLHLYDRFRMFVGREEVGYRVSCYLL